MQPPDFRKGQPLTADMMNDLSNAIARAMLGRVNTGLSLPGVSRTFVQPQEPMSATGEPAMLDVRRGLNAECAPGVYVRPPAVAGLETMPCATPLSLELLTAASTAPGKEWWQVVETDCVGNPVASYIQAGAPSCLHTWDPSTCTSGLLGRRLAQSITNCKWGADAAMPANRVAVVRTHDTVLPELTRSVAVLPPADPAADTPRELPLTAGRKGNTMLLRRFREGGGVFLNHPCFTGCEPCSTVAITSGFDLYPSLDCAGVPSFCACAPLHPRALPQNCWQTLAALNTGRDDCRLLFLRGVPIKPWAWGLNLYAPNGVGAAPRVKLMTGDSAAPDMSAMLLFNAAVITSCETMVDFVPGAESCDAAGRVQWRQVMAPATACHPGYDILLGRYWRRLSPTCSDWSPHYTYTVPPA